MGTAGTPEQGSIGKSPLPPPEGEQKPKGFQVKVESPDLVFGAIERSVSGELGKHLLESPIDEVSVELQAGKDTFNLLGEVSLDFEARHQRNVSDKTIRKLVAQRFVKHNPDGKIVERGGNFIVTASRGTKLVLGEKSVGLDDILISTGLATQLIDEPLQIVPAPPSKRESYDVTMADFIDVFKATVEEAYKADGGKIPPDEELVLRPPKIGTNGRKGRGEGFFGDIKTPDQLLGKLEIGKPDVKFEDVGGQEQAKREIQGIAFALKNPELYKKWGTKPPKGIILYGPPGTGKTLMAKALASQADARFFHVEASDIASKWYGESEQIVKSIFELAGNTGENTIIFFDEMDAIAPQREGSHEATHRVVSTLLENMDGLASRNNVMVVASTNRLESIEPALLRAGRFDRWVEVPLPDEEGRKQIFNIHMKKAQDVAGRDLFNTVNLEAIISKTEKSSGADIAEIIRRALEEKVRQEGTGLQPGEITTEDILKEIKNYERVRETKRAMGFITPPEKTE